MSTWHSERVKTSPLLSIMSQDRRIEALIRYPDKTLKESKFVIFGEKWILDSKSQSNESMPQGWVRLWPKVPITAETFLEAKRLQEEFLERLVAGIDPKLLEERSSEISIIETHTHSSQEMQFRIYQHQGGNFEVRYFRWTIGRGGGWVSTRHELCTYTDSLEEARQVAQSEMEEIRAQLPQHFRRK